MRAWFAAQSPRDQMALMLLSGFLLLFLLFQFALSPAGEARRQMASNNDAASAQLSRVETKVSQLLSLRESGDTGANQNLSSTLSACLLYTSPSPRD